MSSIRNAGLTAILALLAIAPGCSTEPKYSTAPLNIAPIVGDEAMALRSDWPKSVSYYANGDTHAYSTRFPYDVNASRPGNGDVLLDPIMFIAQVAFLPVELVMYPPFKEQVWHGEQLNSTYTAQPPLPPLGGVKAKPIGPIPFLGPQANTPDTNLPGSTAAPPTSPGEPQLPAYPSYSVPAAAAPTPPPFSPGSISGPPVAR